MEETINYFFKEYEKALRTTKSYFNHLKRELRNLKLEEIQDNTELYNISVENITVLHHKLMTLTYLLSENYRRIVQVYDLLDDKQKMLVDQYNTVAKKTTAINDDVCVIYTKKLYEQTKIL